MAGSALVDDDASVLADRVVLRLRPLPGQPGRGYHEDGHEDNEDGVHQEVRAHHVGPRRRRRFLLAVRERLGAARRRGGRRNLSKDEKRMGRRSWWLRTCPLRACRDFAGVAWVLAREALIRKSRVLPRPRRQDAGTPSRCSTSRAATFRPGRGHVCARGSTASSGGGGSKLRSRRAGRGGWRLEHLRAVGGGRRRRGRCALTALALAGVACYLPILVGDAARPCPWSRVAGRRAVRPVTVEAYCRARERPPAVRGVLIRGVLSQITYGRSPRLPESRSRRVLRGFLGGPGERGVTRGTPISRSPHGHAPGRGSDEAGEGVCAAAPASARSCSFRPGLRARVSAETT